MQSNDAKQNSDGFSCLIPSMRRSKLRTPVVFPKILSMNRDDFMFFLCSESVIFTFFALLLFYALYFLILEFLTQSIQAVLFSQQSSNTLMDYG